MFLEEAIWIKNKIGNLDANIESVIDIGASTHDFRTITQPHIDKLIHLPIKKNGGKITVADIKSGEGVDLTLDLSKPIVEKKYFENKYDLLICCNILEHVLNREVFLSNLFKFTKPGSIVLFTVPRLYPLHADPIDTNYRPSIKQLHVDIAKHVSFEVVTSEVITISDKKYYIYKNGRKLDYILFKSLRRKMRWFFQPLQWKVTCTIVKVSSCNKA